MCSSYPSIVRCGFPCALQKRIQDLAGEQFTAENDGVNLLRILDVLKRVGIEKNQVGALSRFNRSLLGGTPEKPGRLARGRREGFPRSQSRSGQIDKIFVKARPGKYIGGSYVRSRQDADARGFHAPNNFQRTLHNFLEQIEVCFGPMFHALLPALFPDFAEPPGHIYHAWILSQIRSRRHESELDEYRECGYLPGVILDEFALQLCLLFGGVSVQQSSLPSAASRQPLFGRTPGRLRRKLLAPQFLLIRRNRQQDTREVLDACLSGIGSFRGGHRVRHMPDESYALLSAFFRDREICFASKPRLHLDEIHPLRLQRMDCLASLHRISDHDRRLIGRRVTVEIRPSEEHLRAQPFLRINLFPQLHQLLDFSSHVADRGDSVRDEKWKDEFSAAARLPRPGQMDMHVTEAGDQEFSGGIDNSRVARNIHRRRGSNRCNFLIFDHDSRIRSWRRIRTIDQRDVGNNERRLDRSILSPKHTRDGRDNEKKEKKYPEFLHRQGLLNEAVVLFQDGAEALVRESDDAMILDAGHRLRGNHGVDDRLLGGLHGRGKKGLDAIVRQHRQLHQALRFGSA